MRLEDRFMAMAEMLHIDAEKARDVLAPLMRLARNGETMNRVMSVLRAASVPEPAPIEDRSGEIAFTDDEPAPDGLRQAVEKCAEVWEVTGHPHAKDHADILRQILARHPTPSLPASLRERTLWLLRHAQAGPSSNENGIRLWMERCDALIAELSAPSAEDALLAQVEKALVVAEWSDYTEPSDEMHGKCCCPVCGLTLAAGHAYTCEIGCALAAVRKAREGTNCVFR